MKEGSPAEKKRSEAQTEEIHSASGAAYDEDQAQDLNSVFDSAEEADPPSEEVGLTGGREKAEVTSPTPEVEAQSELTSGISSAFRNFREQLEQHLTVSELRGSKVILVVSHGCSRLESLLI